VVGSSASFGRSWLRLVDLGAHVGERSLGVIESGLEFEQHVAPPPSKAVARISLTLETDLSLVSTGLINSRSASSG